MTDPRPGRVRIGIDTGGTFTDVVAVDDTSGRLVSTKVPSTPANPADGFLNGVESILTELGASGRPVGPADIGSVLHGTTVATNQLLQGRMGDLGFVTNDGYRFLPEIARQSVPDGYGNSYFWVKPDRIVPVDRVRTVRGRMDHRGTEVDPLAEDDVLAAAMFFARQGISTIGVSLLHSYANPAHELRVRDLLLRALPGAVVSISAEVLPEYREYERAMTTLVDAAVKPTVARYISGIDRRLEALAGGAGAPPPPFSIMRSNGGVLSADQVVGQPITTVLRAEGFADDDQVMERSADQRYFGQAFEVRVPCPSGAIDGSWADAVVEAFHDAHQSLYGYHFRGKADQRP